MTQGESCVPANSRLFLNTLQSYSFPSFLQYVAFKYCHPSSIIMRVATYLSLFLCASSAAASGAINAFKRVDRVLEARAVAQPNAPLHGSKRLHKRASPFLNSATQSGCTANAFLRSDANEASEFVVDGTKIPDVDVCSIGIPKLPCIGLQTYSSMLANPMLVWYQSRPPPTRLGSSSFGAFN